jgi:hypothetical protein
MKAEPEHAETSKASSAWHWFAWTFAIIVIAYPLSIGPVVRLCAIGWLPPQQTLTIYKPLFAIADHVPPANRVLCRYASFWLPTLAL